ncbi:RHS repeat-associated core domain-containing protein [Pseudomonas sp. NBRC 111118]|uniref:RHS repeat-associated core domain-containing protein n=1 Tax=Pseudomonas sp. NBRC 111118 TaxID=1661033 RepID=UPI0006D46A8E|nr:RHS repeat-associated core domain-containing protein [Pseudomonas sp. NBRC 111118]
MPPSTPHTQSPQPICFTPYGHSGGIGDAAIATGFNGVPFDIHANCYHLGQGYRAFFPGLMRFSSPDSMSPFGLGGLNAYAYCNGDPVNYGDPQGTAGVPIGRTGNTPRSGRVTAKGQFGIGNTSHQVKSYRNAMRENEKVQGVDIALDLLDHNVDLFNAVTKDLKKLDNTAVRRNPFVREKLIKASTEAFTDHMKNVLVGQKRRYADDVILTDAHRKYLSTLDSALIRAYAPYREHQSHWYHPGYHIEGIRDTPLLLAQWAIRDAKLLLDVGDSPLYRGVKDSLK